MAAQLVHRQPSAENLQHFDIWVCVCFCVCTRVCSTSLMHLLMFFCHKQHMVFLYRALGYGVQLLTRLSPWPALQLPPGPALNSSSAQDISVTNGAAMTSCTFPASCSEVHGQYLTPSIPTCKSLIPPSNIPLPCNFVHPSRLTLDSVMSFHLAIRILSNMAPAEAQMHLEVGVCLLSCRPCWDHCAQVHASLPEEVELHGWTQLPQTLPEMWSEEY